MTCLECRVWDLLMLSATMLIRDAAAVIAFHNHPSGYLEPSVVDRAVTARLKQALALVDSACSTTLS